MILGSKMRQLSGEVLKGGWMGGGRQMGSWMEEWKGGWLNGPGIGWMDGRTDRWVSR